MIILANISSLEDLLLHIDLSPLDRQQADDLLTAIRSAAIQLAHQESLHSSST